eukprot:2064412-Rhodomonas_salina.3
MGRLSNPQVRRMTDHSQRTSAEVQLCTLRERIISKVYATADCRPRTGVHRKPISWLLLTPPPRPSPSEVPHELETTRAARSQLTHRQ